MWYFILFAATLLLDQISKALIDAHQVGQENPIIIIRGFINIRLDYNEGASFGIFKDRAWAQPFFLILTSVVLIAGVAYICIKKPQGKWLNSTLALMFSGTIGNFIDRIALGKVRDFIDIIHFADCNIADFCLCIGAFMLVIYVLFLDKDAVFKKNEEKRKFVKIVDDDDGPSGGSEHCESAGDKNRW